MKDKRFIQIMQECSKIILSAKGIEEGILCYLKVFTRDLQLKNAAFVTNESTLCSNNDIELSFIEEQKEYFKRNPEVLYIKTLNEGFNSYIYAIQDANFIYLETEREDDFLLLSDVFVAYISSLFFHSVKILESKSKLHLLSNIITNIPNFVAFKDRNDVYQVVSQLTVNEYIDKFNTIVGKSIDEVYPLDEAKVVKQLDNEVIFLGQSIRKEIQVMTDNGYKTVESVRTPIRNEHDDIIGVLSLGHDITEIKRNEEKIHKNIEFQEVLINIATKFINQMPEDTNKSIDEALSLSGTYLDADRAYVFLYDYQTMTTSNTHEWVKSNISPEIENLQNIPISEIENSWTVNHFKSDQVYIEDVDTLDHDGELYKILSMQDIKSLITIPMMNQKECIGFVGFDAVNHLKRWSEKDQAMLRVLSELFTNLLIKQKNQEALSNAIKQAETASLAKTEFLANMSHEIRTPLSGMYNAVYLLNNTKLTDEQRNYIDVLNASLESLSGIVDNVLDLSKIEAGKIDLYYEKVDLEEVIFQLYLMQESIAKERDIELRFEYDYHIPRFVYIDKVRIRQIILNLVNNAIKYTEKGYVLLKVKLVEIIDNTVKINFLVEDTGIGISEANIQKLTEKFYQIDSSLTKKYAGTGLGLPIASNLVGLLGSSLIVASNLGEGSSFSFSLGLEVEIFEKAKVYTKTYGKKLGLIKGNPGFQQLISNFFTSLGMEVWAFNTQQDYIKCPSKNQFDYIAFLEPFNDLNEEIVYTWHKLLGRDNTDIIACYDDALFPTSAYYEMGFDFVFKMPSTRKKVLDILERRTTDVMFERLVDTNDNEENKDLGNILVVDDNRMNRYVLQILLEKLGYHVFSADNGLSGIDILKESPVDLVLMDLQMPEMNGYEATQAIRTMNESFSDVPIIALTANALHEAKEDAYKVGMNDIITKPFIVTTLSEKISTYVQPKKNRNVDGKLYLLKGIEIFDENQFNFTFQGSSELELEIIKAFVEDYQDDLLKIKESIILKDPILIEKTVHYFKGSVAYLSAKRLLFITQEILNQIKINDLSYLNRYYDLLELETTKFVNHITMRYDRGVK